MITIFLGNLVFVHSNVKIVKLGTMIHRGRLLLLSLVTFYGTIIRSDDYYYLNDDIRELVREVIDEEIEKNRRAASGTTKLQLVICVFLLYFIWNLCYISLPN